MKIDVLYSRECPHYLPALQLVYEVLDELRLAAQVDLVRVEDQPEAERLRFLGSPTVRIDGVDVEPYATFARSGFGMKCRLYTDDGEVQGWPSRRIVREAIEVGYLAGQDLLGTCC
jgi:hypothetical protein